MCRLVALEECGDSNWDRQTTPEGGVAQEGIRAFSVYAMGRTSSRTSFDFTDAKSFGKGKARDAYTHPLPLKPY